MANRYYINGGVDNNWNTSGNWSTSSGGAGGAGVPTSADDVILDTNSPGTLNVDIAGACLTFSSSSNTARTINSNSITLGGNMTISNTTTNISGTTTFIFGGTTQTITSSMTSGRWSSPITIAQATPSSTVTFTTGLKYTGVMTHTQGIVLGLLDIDYPPVPSSVIFDGSNEYVEIDAVRTALAATTVGTWRAWVKLVNPTSAVFDAIFAFGENSSTNVTCLLLDKEATTAKLRLVCLENGVDRFRLLTDAAAFTANIWTHIACVQNGTSPVLYVNGSAVAQTFTVSTDKTEWFNSISPTLNTGRIGDRNVRTTGEEMFLNGQIGYCTFWNTNLSAAQVLADYNSGQAIIPVNNLPAYANVVSHFNMGLVDTYPTLTDSVGGKNGTMTNMEASDIMVINRTISNTF